MEHWWTVTGKNRLSEKTHSKSTLVTTNLTLTVLEVNMDLCSDKLPPHC